MLVFDACFHGAECIGTNKFVNDGVSVKRFIDTHCFSSPDVSYGSLLIGRYMPLSQAFVEQE